MTKLEQAMPYMEAFLPGRSKSHDAQSEIHTQRQESRTQWH